MNIQSYLTRIDYRGTTAPTIETLRELHRAHLLTVPFENLDIHWRQRIVLDEEGLFDKIVNRRRGGFCFELNGLFAALLRELGFHVTLLSARTFEPDGRTSPEFDHLVLLVRLQERWLVDVGWGNFCIEPLRFDTDDEQTLGARAFRIARLEANHLYWMREPGADWEKEYIFTLHPRALKDFVPRCDYLQSAPESVFVRRRMCTRMTDRGRIILKDLQFAIVEDGVRIERDLADEREGLYVLRDQFGINL